MTLELTIAQQPVVLLPSRMIHLRQTSTLLVADLHFGKAATFRRSGIPVPVGTTERMLLELSQQLKACRAQRFIFLGDLFHSNVKASNDYQDELLKWRQQHCETELILVEGNHDRGNRPFLESLNIDLVKEPFHDPPFYFCHIAENNSQTDGFTFAGHVHPAIRLRGAVSEGKLPCFAMNRSTMLLPAFGQFTGTAVVSRKQYPDIFVIADDLVLEV